MTAERSLWQIPGGRQFINEAAEHLEAQECLILAVPQLLDVDDLPYILRREVPSRRWTFADVAEIDRYSEDPLLAVARWLQLELPEAELFEDSFVVAHPDLTQDVLWLDGLAELAADRRRTWTDALRRWARAARSAEREAALMVAVARGAAAADDLPEDPGLTVQRWWGRLGRLDVMVHLQHVAHHLTVTERAQVAELAAYDLRLAERLAEARTVEVAGVLGVVADHVQDIGLDCSGVNGNLLCRAEGPGDRAKPWAHGAIDRFDDAARVATHLGGHLDDADEVVRRLWHGQIRTVMPQLEQWRADLIDRARSLGYLARGIPADDFDFGPLARHLSGGSDRDRRRRRLADFAFMLRDGRNCVAHLEPLSEGRWRQLQREAAALQLG